MTFADAKHRDRLLRVALRLERGTVLKRDLLAPLALLLRPSPSNFQQRRTGREATNGVCDCANGLLRAEDEARRRLGATVWKARRPEESSVATLVAHARRKPPVPR